MRTLVLIAPLALFAASADAQVDAVGRPIDGLARLAPPATPMLPASGNSPAIAGEWRLLPFVARATSSWADSVAIGDVTGDSRSDIALTTSYYFDPANDYRLFLFPQGADGTLLAPTKFPYGQTANRSSVVVMDIDGEYGSDVVVGATTGLSVFRATAAGSLMTLAPQASQAAEVMVTTDLDGNGREDLASVSWSNGGRVHFSQGNGAFQSSPWAARVQGYNSMARGDLDGDGRVDVAVASGQGLGPSIWLYRNTGSGLMEMRSLTGVCPGWYYPSVAGIGIGDVNGDGYADVVASSGGNRPGSCIQVFLADASGSFSSPIYYASYDIPETLRVVDVNGDGRSDIVTLHGGWNAIGVYLQLADGTLAQERRFPIPYASHYSAHGMDIADFTGDHCPDVAIADYNHGLVVLNGGDCTGADGAVNLKGSAPDPGAVAQLYTTDLIDVTVEHVSGPIELRDVKVDVVIRGSGIIDAGDECTEVSEKVETEQRFVCRIAQIEVGGTHTFSLPVREVGRSTLSATLSTANRDTNYLNNHLQSVLN